MRTLVGATGAPQWQTVRCRPSRRIRGSTSTVTFRTSARGAAQLIWQRRLFTSLINSLTSFCFEVRSHSHLFTMECVSSLSFSRRRSTYLIWLILFPFFLLTLHPIVKCEQSDSVWCTLSWLLSWRPVSNNDGITLTILYLRHTSPFQSVALMFDSFSSILMWIFRSCYIYFLRPSMSTLIGHDASVEHLRCCFLQLVVFFCASVCFRCHPWFAFIDSLSSCNRRWLTAANEEPWSAACTISLTCIPSNAGNKRHWHPLLILSSLFLSHTSKD